MASLIYDCDSKLYEIEERVEPYITNYYTRHFETIGEAIEYANYFKIRLNSPGIHVQYHKKAVGV